jgi:hypothetical protein
VPPRRGRCRPHSAALDLTTRGRTVSSLFGDGAGAVVVSATDEDRGIRGTWLGADGRFGLNLCQKVWDIKKRPFMPLDANGVGQVTPEMAWAQMDGKITFAAVANHMGQQTGAIDLFRRHKDRHREAAVQETVTHDRSDRAERVQKAQEAIRTLIALGFSECDIADLAGVQALREDDANGVAIRQRFRHVLQKLEAAQAPQILVDDHHADLVDVASQQHAR